VQARTQAAAASGDLYLARALLLLVQPVGCKVGVSGVSTQYQALCSEAVQVAGKPVGRQDAEVSSHMGHVINP